MTYVDVIVPLFTALFTALLLTAIPIKLEDRWPKTGWLAPLTITFIPALIVWWIVP